MMSRRPLSAPSAFSMTAAWLLAALTVAPVGLVESAEPAAGPSPREGQAAVGPEEVHYTSVQHLPRALTVARLSNGLTVMVQENHVAPVATVRCFVRNTGSAYEGQWMGAGLSHVLEHVVAGGSTTKRSEKEIAQIIDTFGGATNAFTSTEMTVYFIDCPARNTLQAVELVADSMQHVKFDPDEFARELKVVRRELADGEVNRARVLHELLNRTLYLEHPVRHPVIGYLDVLNRTTNQTIIDFYRQRYIPGNQVFVVVGDVNAQEVLDQVAKQWAGNARNYETVVTLPDEPEQIAPRETMREMEGTTFDFAVAWPTVKLSHPDLCALDVAAYILAEGDSSRLVYDLKHRRQLVLSVSGASYTPDYVRGWFGFFASAKPEKWKEASDEIVRAVYRLRDELVDPAELAKAKKQKAAELVFESQTVQQAADALGRNLLSAGDPLFDERYVQEIQKVTAEQIRDVARRYFVPQRLNRAIVAPRGAAAGDDIKQAAAAAESPVRLQRLPNGLRVLVKRVGHLPLVNVQAFVLAGTLADAPQTAGRSSLLATMLEKGVAGRSAQEIADYFDSIGGRMSMSAGRNTIYGSATTLRGDFPQALALFAQCFTQPTLPAEEFAKAKQLALAAIARRADDPHREINELFCDSLPADSPYHIQEGGTKESVQRMTLDDLRAYHASYFVPNNMIVTLYGDLDPDEAAKWAEVHFGKLKAAADFQPVSFDRPNHVPEDVTRHKQTQKPTGMVMMGYPCPSVRDQADYPPMVLLDAITSGYSYPGGWLHEELRGQGLVYFVHAYQLTGPAAGFFTIFSQTRPDKIAEVVERITRNLERAKNGKISPEEFKTAQQMVIALHAQENTTIAAQARQAALDEMYGLGYDYDKRFDQRIEAVKLDDVVRVARKYLNHRVLTTSSPEAGKKP